MAPVSEVADLYGLPLDDFISERDRLVRQLRDEGKVEEASEVSKLRKPTTDAWALNQVARRHPEQMEGLLTTHGTLRQSADGDAVRRTSDERRRLVDELVEAAASTLEQTGHSSAGSVRDRIVRTLLAAAGDPDTEQNLARGTLDRPVEISPQWPTARVTPGTDQPEDEDSEWREQVEHLESRAEQLDARAQDLRQTAREAKSALDRARREAEAADRAAREAEQAARQAQQEAKKARRRRRGDL